MKRAIVIALVVAAIGGGAAAYYLRRGGPEVTVNTSPVTRGELVDTVGATGALQAVTTVQVGSQVSGIISELHADFNSIVKKDQVIAKLDPSLFDAQVQQAQANLSKSRADLERNKVALVDANQKYTRAKGLSERSLIPQSDYDAAKVAVDSAEAQVKSSEADVVQAQASLNQGKVNLEHTIITAPIDGIVIQRSVDVGQTVAASLQSPTLFIIAADLTKMQVNANIDESDVGRIRPKQVVSFRVDAYPGEEFNGIVSQIRLQPVVVQNVTTYGTIIDVPNADLRLKPGMTANLRVQIAKRNDVVRVPNAAIRFRPTSDIFAALNQAPPADWQFGGRGRGQNGRGRADYPADADSASAGQPAGAGAPAGANGRRAAAASPEAAQGRGSAFGGPARGADEGGRGSADARGRMMDRFREMSPADQKQFIARMKERGVDTSAFEAIGTQKNVPAPPKAKAGQGAETIDALFAPLPPVESRGRVWLYVNKELKPVALRLGITDGTNTELLSGDVQPGMALVTGVLTTGRATQSAGSGNPLLGPQQGRGRDGFGGFGGGGFGGGGRGR